MRKIRSRFILWLRMAWRKLTGRYPEVTVTVKCDAAPALASLADLERKADELAAALRAR